MQTDNKLLDDLARVMTGAMGTLVGVRDEVEAQIRQQLERVLSRMDVVSRDEFDAVRQVATTARAEQEALTARVAELERRLADLATAGAVAPTQPPHSPSEP